MKLENLEAARGFAALYVLLHHLDPLAGTRLQPLLRFGQEAVIMFFLVSGFVIYLSYAKSKGGQTPGEFMWRRALRIYPIFILALGLAVLANAVKGDMSCLTVQDLVGNLLMLQDIARVKGGTWVAPLCTNTPLWSLSYEWWFYVAFTGLFLGGSLSGHNSKRIAVAAIVIFGTLAYIALPAQPFLFASYFCLWWAGLELAMEYVETGSISLRGQRFSIALMLVGAALWALLAIRFVAAGRPLSTGAEPVLQIRHFATGIILVLAVVLGRRFGTVPKQFVMAFSRIAPISYGLYVSHQPVIILVHELDLPRIAEICISILCALACAYILELVFQPAVMRVFSEMGLTKRPREAR
ncbi:acyltransferase [Cupriavidus necator]|uniref:Acyltransferase n=1 Tax=Cupriavidus necator TaxID=106590 RepID=A0A367PRU6_CUPNE|nr:acyltransferase [Cupriavidus necator]QQX88677.1 acyltransferase [Cupriavidus necator]RCJ09827.1 acyltransferase [Cupriavidus necator]